MPFIISLGLCSASASDNFYLTKHVSFLTEASTCTFLRCALYLDLCNFRESRIRAADFQRYCCSYSQPISSSAELLSVLYHVSDAVSCLLLAGDARTLLPPPEQMVWSFPPRKQRTCFQAAEMPRSKSCRDSSKYTSNHNKNSAGNLHQ